jgi:hypothetical protein
VKNVGYCGQGFAICEERWVLWARLCNSRRMLGIVRCMMSIFCEECGVCWCGIACKGREIGYRLFHETGILVQRICGILF